MYGHFIRFGFSTKTIGEHGSPLHRNTQYSSYQNIFIKQLHSSKRAPNERPYDLQSKTKSQET